MEMGRPVHLPRGASLHWLLVFAVMAQAALPLQAHTKLAADRTGQVVVICTWEGLQERRFPHDGGDPQPMADELSPALLFSQLLASADINGDAQPVKSVLIPVIKLTEVPRVIVQAPVASVYSIRAPPQRVFANIQFA